MIEYLVLGLVQGMTEFLPVSSSGHLFLLQQWFGMEPGIELEVMLHVASLVAVVWVFRKKLWCICLDTLSLVRNTPSNSPSEGEKTLGFKIIVATLFTVPTALLIERYFLYDLTVQAVAWSLIVTGGLVLVSHLMSNKEKGIRENGFSWLLVVLIGLIQGFAVLPGISRSGLTIAVLMMLGLARKQSAEISFLLSIPTILGALVFSLKDIEGFASLFHFPFALSLVICTLISWLTIKFMLQTINRYWIYFMPYCVLLGIGLLLLY